MTALAQRLARRIMAEGPIPIADYMAAALLDPEAGYYRRGTPAIGAEGDFITAPEISQLFGELIGAWCATMWEAIGRPRSCHLIELGPGRGTLLADALRTLARVAPVAFAALAPRLIEVDPASRQRQAEALAGLAPRLAAAPSWHEGLDAVPAGPFLLVANEFFDALPIHQFVHRAGGWRERLVDVEAATGGFRVVEGAPVATPPPASRPGEPVADGEIWEWCPMGEALARDLGARLCRDAGAALILDYGPARSALGDSLQALRRHRFADILDKPGESDLSHHVDFQALARAAAEAGAAAHGPVPQGLFLGRLGIDRRAEALIAALPEGAERAAQSRAIEGQARRLVHPGRMGVLFKVLALTAPGGPTPPGFAASARAGRG